MIVYIVTHLVFMTSVFLIVPGIYFYMHGREGSDKSQALGLPKGSVRALIAFSVVGSFLITASLGPLFIDSDYFSIIISAKSALVGGAIGYYFGSKPTKDS